MAVAALVKAQEWKEWLEYWQPKAGERKGWERLVVDGTALLQQICVRDARFLRRGGSSRVLATYHEGYSDDEMHDFVDVAERDVARYQQWCGQAEKDAPEWAKFLFRATEGALLNRVRLAREFRQVQRRGYLTINVNPEARNKDFVAGREDFRGAEVG